MPLSARTQTFHAATNSHAFDRVTFTIVRAGSAQFFSELGTRCIKLGDVVVLAANTRCSAEPEESLTATTIYLARDYVIDQVFWQHAKRFRNRHEAHVFLHANYPAPVHVVRIGKNRAELLMPWLDELAALSIDGLQAEHFYRAQALLSRILDVLTPHLTVTDQRATSRPQNTVRLPVPRHGVVQPLRTEVRRVADQLANELDRRWSVPELARAVHLSPSQLRRAFVASFGKSPIAYLTMLRAERMAHLLKVTDLPVSVIATSVGWRDPDFAALQFRRTVGVTPSEYRRIDRNNPPPPHPD
ncbi:helix-turn-helix domain-containing protein [Microbacterium sp. AGC85]